MKNGYLFVIRRILYHISSRNAETVGLPWNKSAGEAKRKIFWINILETLRKIFENIAAVSYARIRQTEQNERSR